MATAAFAGVGMGYRFEHAWIALQLGIEIAVSVIVFARVLRLLDTGPLSSARATLPDSSISIVGMRITRAGSRSLGRACSKQRPWRTGLAMAMIVEVLMVAGTCDAQPSRHRRHTSSHSGETGNQARQRQPQTDDTLYRTRGYGLGGIPFSVGDGGGGLALSGACAQVANLNPACGPRGGYGIYGNGLGYGSP